MVAQKTDSAIRQKSIPALVLIYSDGFIETYGEKNLDVFIINVPETDSKRAELLAEEYVEINIPVRHRHIYTPGLIRAVKLGRVVTADEIYETRQSLSMIRALEPINFLSNMEATS